MKIIEFVGIPGSGKSTLQESVRESLLKKGINALTREEAIFKAMKKKWWFLMSGLIFDQPLSLIMSERIYKKLISESFKDRFSKTYETLIKRILFYQKSIEMPVKHKKALMRWFINFGGEYYFLKEHLDARDYVIYSEGFVNRTLNFFISDESAQGWQLVKVLHLLPFIDTLIMVDAECRACAKRMAIRGATTRLAGKNEDDIARFLENAKRIMGYGVGILKDQGRNIIEINNDDNLVNVRKTLKARFSERILC